METTCETSQVRSTENEEVDTYRYSREAGLLAKNLFTIETSGTRCPKLKTQRLYSYIPSAHQLMRLVHEMDTIYIKNKCETGDVAWHPFISRIYFGMLFFFRVMQVSAPEKISDFKRFQTMRSKINKYFAEDATYIPKPLLELFQELAPQRGNEKSPEMWITPTLPEVVGPDKASKLLDFDEDHCYQLLLPNIPVYLGLLHNFLESAMPEIDNRLGWLCDLEKFDDNVDRDLNGNLFKKQEWTVLQRTVFLTPGLSHIRTTIYGFEKRKFQKRRLKEFGLPKPQPDDNLNDIFSFLYIDKSAQWFSLVCHIMAPYCRFFSPNELLSDVNLGRPDLLPTLSSYFSSPCEVKSYKDFVKTVRSIDHQKVLLCKRFMSNEGYLSDAPSEYTFSRHQLNVRVCTDNVDAWGKIGTFGKTRWINREDRSSRGRKTFLKVESFVDAGLDLMAHYNFY